MPAFITSVENGIARLQLSRPEASNALTVEFWTGLAPAIQALDARGDVRVLVISGQGRHFCAGMDISVFSGSAIFGTDSPAERQLFMHIARTLQDALTAVERARFPVIAAVQGACIGAGLELAAVCDLRYASANTSFRVEEINIGMMADVGALQRLPRQMPEAVVKEMAFLGRTLTADRAAAIGFVNAVHPTPEDTLAAALAAAAEIAARAPLAMAGSKAALRFARDNPVAAGLDWAAMMQASLWNTGDILNAIQSRMTKQPGEFAPLLPLRGMGG
jgi:enoyl-CoA hydratase